MSDVGYRVLEADGITCTEYFGGPPHHTLEEVRTSTRSDKTIEEVEIVRYRELKAGSLFYPTSMSSVLHQVTQEWAPVAQMNGDGTFSPWPLVGGLGVIGLMSTVGWTTVLVQASGNVPVFKWTGKEYS